ncbi:unnamed protein product [Calypogeia fissa]
MGEKVPCPPHECRCRQSDTGHPGSPWGSAPGSPQRLRLGPGSASLDRTAHPDHIPLVSVAACAAECAECPRSFPVLVARSRFCRAQAGRQSIQCYRNKAAIRRGERGGGGGSSLEQAIVV